MRRILTPSALRRIDYRERSKKHRCMGTAANVLPELRYAQYSLRTG